MLVLRVPSNVGPSRTRSSQNHVEKPGRLCYNVHVHLGGAEILIPGAVIVPVGPERNILDRSGVAQIAAVAGRPLHMDHRGQTVEGRGQTHAGEFLDEGSADPFPSTVASPARLTHAYVSSSLVVSAAPPRRVHDATGCSAPDHHTTSTLQEEDRMLRRTASACPVCSRHTKHTRRGHSCT